MNGFIFDGVFCVCPVPQRTRNAGGAGEQVSGRRSKFTSCTASDTSDLILLPYLCSILEITRAAFRHVQVRHLVSGLTACEVV